MPYLRIETNLPRSDIPKDFVNKAIPVIANAIGKPESKCVCSVSAEQLISVGGEVEAPAATGNLMSIGHLGPDDNRRIAAVLARLLEEELGVASHRFLLTFQDESPWNVSIRGTTAQALAEQ